MEWNETAQHYAAIDYSVKTIGGGIGLGVIAGVAATYAFPLAASVVFALAVFGGGTAFLSGEAQFMVSEGMRELENNIATAAENRAKARQALVAPLEHAVATFASFCVHVDLAVNHLRLFQNILGAGIAALPEESDKGKLLGHIKVIHHRLCIPFTDWRTQYLPIADTIDSLFDALKD